MIALMNALQAGNRSGTGVYAVELARRLPGLARRAHRMARGLAVAGRR